MKELLKEPLTFERIFGVLEPKLHEDITIYQQTSIKNILDCFPIKYNDDLTELDWSVDDCCAGWFLKENKDSSYGYSHAGCDGNCGKEISDSENDYLELLIPNYPRETTNTLEFMIYKDSKKWILKFIPKDMNKLYTMPCSLHIQLY